MTQILYIKDLVVSTNDKIIINGLSLEVNSGETHAIMGPNGSGKSTLAKVLSRHNDYQVNAGKINFLGENLLEKTADECARLGLLMGFQYPVELPGVSNIHFLKTAVNAMRKHRGQKALDAVDFIKQVKEKMTELEIPEEFLYRSVNTGFSGGEKKRNEMLQISLLDSKFAVLDETDSGLDIDSLKIVARCINALKNKQRGLLLITHYQRLLDYIEPDFVHVIASGHLVHTGNKYLPKELEKRGYAWLNQKVKEHHKC